MLASQNPNVPGRSLLQPQDIVKMESLSTIYGRKAKINEGKEVP